MSYIYNCDGIINQNFYEQNNISIKVLNPPPHQLNDIKLITDTHNSYKLLPENNINCKAINKTYELMLNQKSSSDVNNFNDLKLLHSMHTR